MPDKSMVKKSIWVDSHINKNNGKTQK
jgi:hypothetical protein